MTSIPQLVSPQQRHSHVPWGRWSIRVAALSYLGALLILPLLIIAIEGLREGPRALWNAISNPIAWHALKLTLWTSGVMALINGVMGLITAYVLVRYQFPGKRLLNALIDLPFAIPTLVAGVMLVVLYGPQQALGAWLAEWGIHIIFAPSGIVLALLFVSFPFVVRTVQPVLVSLSRSQEEAAATLGAAQLWIFFRVTFPPIRGALLSGMLLSFARAIGEFGAIVVVAGNIPLYTQTASVYVFGEIESDQHYSASAMSMMMLLIAWSVVTLVNYLQQRQKG